MRSQPIYERFRPRSLAEVLGQPRAVAGIRSVLDRGGFGGRSVWLSGASGTGKTTLARIIADSVADDWAVTECVGRELSASGVRELWRGLECYSMGKGGRAVIINEAHGLSSPAIEVLLDALEAVPSHAVVIFTTTKDGQEGLFADHDDAGPLLGRCLRFNLTNQGLAEAFAARALEIARGEGLDGQPIEAYVKLARKCKNSMRAMLTEIEAGAMIAG